jgi:predicted RNase H-like HicB family nuclease
MRVPVHVQQRESQGSVQVFCPDLPGCSAAAPTMEEALELLRRRIGEYFTASTRRAPAGTRIVTIEV